MRLSGLNKVVFILAIGLGFTQCGSTHQDDPSPNAGSSSATNGQLVFFLSDSVEVHIPGHRSADGMALYNGEERIDLLPVNQTCYRVPVFDGTLCLDAQGMGVWTDVLRTVKDPYTIDIQWFDSNPMVQDKANWSSSETWRMSFGTEDPWFGDLVLQRSPSGLLQGTVETATGDFRYLHGTEKDHILSLQTFDGAHLFHFRANTSLKDSLIEGLFSSGSHYNTPFTAHLKTDSDVPLASGMEATWTELPIAYSAIGLNGDSTVWSWSNTDSVTHILSIMGSWCPNCMDEHRLLAGLMDKHTNVHVHTLAFERGLDRENGREMALNRLRAYSESMGLTRYPDRWHVNLVGPASKKQAQQLLPFLDKVVSFPTSLVLSPGADRPWIHSGFNGPATGVKYDLERARFAAAVSGSQGSH